VFSVKSTGGLLTITATATDGPFTFTELLSPNGQNFFTLRAVNGEVISDLDVSIAGGVITDFEHYRVDVASVPGPVVGAGIPGLFGLGLLLLARFRNKRNGRCLTA